MSVGRGISVVALACVMLLAGFIAPPAEAQKRKDPLAGLTGDQRRVFQNYTRIYCKQFFRFEDSRFVLLPNYERSRDNSTGKSYDQAKEEMTEYVEVGTGRRKAILPPTGEVIVASKVIPAIEVGHYGFINSVTIKDIIGPDEMVVSSIVLIPAGEVGTKNNSLREAAALRQRSYEYKNYRLLGFSTKDLKEGQKYYGPRKKGLQVAVMSTDPQHGFVMVNYEKLKKVRTSEFHEALAYVKIEPLDFINMVRENRQNLGTEGDKASLISIYRRYYNRYRPKRLSSITRTTPTPIIRTEPEPEPEPDPEPEQERPRIDWPEDREPEPEPEPEPQPQPEQERPRQPEPEEEEEDDWDLEEDTQDESDEPSFFGIPL